MHDLKTQLDEYLNRVVERIDADDVVNRPDVRIPRLGSSRRSSGRIRGWVYVGAAAVLTLLIGGMSVYLISRRIDPIAASSGSPSEGELIVNMWSHDGPDEWFSLYLYADGRLIWEDGANPETTTGWVEQRLSAEGVSLVHKEVLDTGLFDPDHPGEPRRLPALGHIQVRTESGLAVRWNRTVIDHPIRDRLRDLNSWLPADAWADPEPEQYVPSSYGVCLEYSGTIVPADPSVQLAALPTSARALLTAALHYRPHEFGATDPAVAATWYSPHCYEVSADQEKTLVGVLEAAGLTHETDLRLQFETMDSESRTVHVIIGPFMPHGAPAI